MGSPPPGRLACCFSEGFTAKTRTRHACMFCESRTIAIAGRLAWSNGLAYLTRESDQLSYSEKAGPLLFIPKYM